MKKLALSILCTISIIFTGCVNIEAHQEKWRQDYIQTINQRTGKTPKIPKYVTAYAKELSNGEKSLTIIYSKASVNKHDHYSISLAKSEDGSYIEVHKKGIDNIKSVTFTNKRLGIQAKFENEGHTHFKSAIGIGSSASLWIDDEKRVIPILKIFMEDDTTVQIFNLRNEYSNVENLKDYKNYTKEEKIKFIEEFEEQMKIINESKNEKVYKEI